MTSRLTTAACAVALATGFGVATIDQAEAKERWKMHSAFGQNVAVIGPPGYQIGRAHV